MSQETLVLVVANPVSPDSLLGSSAAVVVLCLVLFAECGLLIGFFLPGDTLLFAAGIGLATGSISAPLWSFLLLAPIAAFVGNLVGYAIGYRAGPVVFDSSRGRRLPREYLARTERFFNRFGKPAIVVGRFVPIVRTVVTVLAGAVRMRFAAFVIFSAVGAIIWADGVLLLGHALGHVQWVRDHRGMVDYAVLAVIVLGLVPALVHAVRMRRST